MSSNQRWLFRTVVLQAAQLMPYLSFCRLFSFSCFETMRNVMSQHSKYWGSLKIGGKLNSSISTVQVVSLSISSLPSFTYSVISLTKHILSTWFIASMGTLRHQYAGQWFFIKFSWADAREHWTITITCTQRKAGAVMCWHLEGRLFSYLFRAQQTLTDYNWLPANNRLWLRSALIVLSL